MAAIELTSQYIGETEANSILSQFEVKVSDYIAEMKLAPQMVTIDAQESLVGAFSTLVSNQILSAPVKEKGHFVGFLDVRDLVSFVLFAAREHAKHAEDLTLEQIMAKEDFFKPHTTIDLYKQTKMHENPVQAVTVAYLCRRNKFAAVQTTDKLTQVLHLLASNEIHRVPVQDEQGNLVAVISQSNIIDYLAQIVQKDPGALQQSIADLKLGHCPVFTALATAPATLAFDLMDKKHVYGLAVVDDQGALVGNISASDLKLFLRNPNFSILDAPLIEFLTAIRSKEIRTRVPVLSVPLSTTLASVISKLAATKMHRLYVCDESKHPTLVISLTDVLSAFLRPLN